MLGRMVLASGSALGLAWGTGTEKKTEAWLLFGMLFVVVVTVKLWLWVWLPVIQRALHWHPSCPSSCYVGVCSCSLYEQYRLADDIVDYQKEDRIILCFPALFLGLFDSSCSAILR